MSNFLDPLLIGIRTILQGSNAYQVRKNLRIDASVVTDDAANDTTILTIAGGGGGGIPATASPIDVSPTSAVGTSLSYAREDHAHKLSTAGLSAATSTLSADLSFNSRKLRGLGAPALSTDAARLQDVSEAEARAKFLPVVRCVDDGGGIPNTGIPGIAMDGVFASAGDLVVRMGYGAASGPWIVSAGAWTRPSYWASGSSQRGGQWMVEEGDYFGGQGVCVLTPGPITVDTTALAFDTFTLKVKTLYGEVYGPDYLTKVQSASGDLMTNRFDITCPKVRAASDSNLGYTETILANVSTGSTTPVSAVTRAFEWSAGAITVTAQVDTVNASGVVESHWLKETRSYDSTVAPVLIGTAGSDLKPASPIHGVALSWSTTSVALVITPANATGARFTCFVQVSELPHP